MQVPETKSSYTAEKQSLSPCAAKFPHEQMVVWCTHNLRRDGSSFMWHQPCQRCKYTTSVDIQPKNNNNKTRYKKKAVHSCRITYDRSESVARERRTAAYKSDQQQLLQGVVSRFGLAVRRSAGKQRDLGSNPLRLSFLFKNCGLWTLSCDFVPHS